MNTFVVKINFNFAALFNTIFEKFNFSLTHQDCLFPCFVLRRSDGGCHSIRFQYVFSKYRLFRENLFYSGRFCSVFYSIQGNAGFQPGGGIASSGHGYGRGYNTFGTNVYYGGGVGGAYGKTQTIPH